MAFIVSSLPMWRGQGLLDLLLKDSRFKVSVMLLPFASYSSHEKEECLQNIHAYFAGKGIPVEDLGKRDCPEQYLREVLNPDILFYPQQYYWLYENGLDSFKFEDKLLCFIPYSLNIINEPWIFNQRFSNVAWRLFYPTPFDKEAAEKYALNKGQNVRVVGNPTADLFLANSHVYAWKSQEKVKKKIIWAPHFSIEEGGFIYRGSFLLIYNEMLQIAKRYRDHFQFVFKPHPRLATELYKHPDWGKERTNAYYQEWAVGENTQLETGSYIDLFMTSDAMIHDCVSFTAEYHYSHNPTFFFTTNIEQTERQLNTLGLNALHAHYIGSETQDIIDFLENVVLNGNDSMKDTRQAFFNHYLLPIDGRSVAENIHQEIVTSIWN
ncbi:MAG: CDP-glycerol glycerophosphotransferase family protein [Bacteroidales bacterium]|nr:CDP-glycerol glycerophosphotransferase family protein [Bacteroidales bacterium]